jgi:leader peptidase (prepilin peptidase)/N-methyltransferase
MAATIGQRLILIPHLLMVSLTAMLVVTDFDHFRIPNRLLYPGGALCIAALTVAALIEDRAPSLTPAFLGAAGYFTLLLLVYLAARGEGFGFGDVKLAILLGFFAAFSGWRVLAYSLFITSLLGGIPALVLLAMGRSRKTSIPYGPPLIFGTWAAIIWAPYLPS